MSLFGTNKGKNLTYILDCAKIIKIVQNEESNHNDKKPQNVSPEHLSHGLRSN